MPVFTPTALSRWSSAPKQLPSIDQVSEINVFDFDNTLFRTPLPNPQIWDGRSIGTISSDDAFVNGGWWHDNSLLSATGGGIDIQEPKAWDGFWDENIVKEVRQSMASPTALTVLMTGRGQANFSDILARMVKSKGLDFDMMVLKPKVDPNGIRHDSTLDFKKEFFRTVVLTYKHATELTIFEDRPKQAKGFENYLAELNEQWSANPASARDPIRSEVVLVEPRLTYFDTQTELDAIMRLVNASNLAVKMGRGKHSARTWNVIKSRIYTGYLVQPKDTARLLNLVKGVSADEMKDFRTLADNIMISFRPPRDDIVRRAGGWGGHRKWRVNGLGSHAGNIFAARLSPVDPNLSTYTESFTPLIVLSMKRSVKASEANRIANWSEISANDERAIVFDSVVQDKVVIKLVEAPENGHYSADGRLIVDGNSFDRGMPAQNKGTNRGGVYSQQLQDQLAHPSEQSWPADYSDGAEAFPPLNKATQQANPGPRRRGGFRDRQQQVGGGPNRSQGRNFQSGGQYGQGGQQQYGQGGRARHGRGGRGGGGRGGQGRHGQYRSLDDASGGDPGGTAGMMY